MVVLLEFYVFESGNISCELPKFMKMKTLTTWLNQSKMGVNNFKNFDDILCFSLNFNKTDYYVLKRNNIIFPVIRDN